MTLRSTQWTVHSCENLSSSLHGCWQQPHHLAVTSWILNGEEESMIQFIWSSIWKPGDSNFWSGRNWAFHPRLLLTTCSNSQRKTHQMDRIRHTSNSNKAGYWCRQPRLVTYATEISLLRTNNYSNDLVRRMITFIYLKRFKMDSTRSSSNKWTKP